MKTTKKLLSLLLCAVMALGLVPFTAMEARAENNDPAFTNISVSCQKTGQETTTVTSVYTVTIDFTLVNQQGDTNYVRALLAPQSITDENGEEWGSGSNGNNAITLNKSANGKGQIIISNLTPGKYKLTLYAWKGSSSNGAPYTSYVSYNTSTKEGTLYTVEKLEQQPLRLADPNGVLNNLTYGSSVPNTLGMGVTSTIHALYMDTIKSSDESVVKINRNHFSGLEIVSAGEFYIVATSDYNNYWKAKTTTFGPYTVKKKPLNVMINVNDKQYDGTNNATFEATLGTGVLKGDDVALSCDGVTASFASSTVGDNIPVTFSGNFALTGEDADNYELVIPQNLTANIYNHHTAQKGVDYTVNSSDWLNEDFVVTAKDGYSLSLTDTATGTWTEDLSATEETANGALEFYVKNNETGAISLKATENYKIDKTAPTGAITVQENSWEQDKNWDALESDISFDIFSKDKYIVTIGNADTLSGVAKTEYFISSAPIDNVSTAQVDWKTYPTGGFELTQNGKYIIYAKITDNSNNVTYISSQGMVIDKTVPVITGAENGKTYCSAVEITVTEDNLMEVTVGGTAVTLTGGKFIVSPADVEQTIVVTDRAGNSETITITVNDGHTFTNYVSDNNATCTEDGTKTAECDYCDETDTVTDTDSALGHNWSVSYDWAEDGSSCSATHICGRSSAHNETVTGTVGSQQTKAATWTEKGQTTYTATFTADWAEEQTKVLDDIDALGHEKVSHEVKTATCTEIGWNAYETCTRCDYTTYAEIPATGHSYGTEWKSDKDNHWHECSACGDKADEAKHTPKTVNAKEATTSQKGYTGDTVCEVCGYEIAKGKVIPVLSDPNNPQTGDNSHMALWLALMLLSCGGVIGTTVYSKKKRTAKR